MEKALNNCWAQSLGNCASKISREHILSAALWEDATTIQVIGFRWCKTEPKTVGVANITSKILCTTHNNALSEVDTAGAAAFRELKEAAARAGGRWRARGLRARSSTCTP